MSKHTFTIELPEVWRSKMKKRSGQKVTSKYWGVSRERTTGRYRAMVSINSKTICLGSFDGPDAEKQAAELVDRWLVRERGEMPRNALLDIFERYQEEFFIAFLRSEFSDDRPE